MANHLDNISYYYHSKLFKNLEQFDEPIQPNKLSTLHFNIRSLPKHHTELVSLQLDRFFDVISLNETWLKPTIPDSLFAIPNFNIVRHDRNCSKKVRGGGAALLVNNNFQYSQLSQPSSLLNEVCDSVWIKIKTKNHLVIVASIYLPPDADKAKFLTILASVLSLKSICSKHILLLGDFNIDWNKSDKIRQDLENTMNSFGLSQQVLGITHLNPNGKESLLDLCFISDHTNHSKCSILMNDISDHYCIQIALSLSCPRPPRKLISYRSFKHFSPPAFYNEAKSLPFLPIACDTQLNVNDKVLKIETLIQTLLNKHAPVKTIRVRGEKCAWLTPNVLKLINHRKKFYKKMKNMSSPSDGLITAFRKFNTYVTNQIRKAKRNYYADTFSKDDSSFFGCVRSLIGKHAKRTNIDSLTADQTELTNPADIANALNKHFTSRYSSPSIHTSTMASHKMLDPRFKFHHTSPTEISAILISLAPQKKGGLSQTPCFVFKQLTHLLSLPLSIIFNQCVDTHKFPNPLKIALVTPVYKKGSPKDPGNYRPISSLPIISKIFEKILFNQLSKYTETNSLLSKRQFGFRKNHSSDQMLMSLLQHWYSSIDNKKLICALSLDVKKAFDSISHPLLLHKLACFGLHHSAVDIISSYLSGRLQITKVAGSLSSPSPISAGVPQGSILGPLLFNLAINDLLESFQTSFAYADDTLIYEITDNATRIPYIITDLFKNIHKWYQNNSLELNIAKTQVCIFSSKKIPSVKYINLNGHTIKIDNNLKVVGIILDSHLNFNEHVQQTVNKTSKMMYLLNKTRKYLNISLAKHFYTSYIRCKLEYCSNLFLNLSSKNKLSLEAIQNRAIRIILRAPKIFSVTDGRRVLNLHTLESRRRYLFVRFITRKLLKNKCSPYLTDLLKQQPCHSLSLRSTCRSILPQSLSSFGSKSFLYNTISILKRQSNSLSDILSFELG